MFSGSGSELPQKSFQIKQENKSFSRLLSKENSISNPSFRVYYGGVSGAVPFLWESQPGTPKHPSSDSSLPPLTPPPSYYSPHHNSKQPSKNKHYSRSKLLNTLFLKISLKKPHVPSSPSSTSSASSFLSSSSWSSSRSSVSANSNYRGRSRFSSERSSFDDEEVSMGSPNSTLCFGRGSGEGIRRVYSVVIVKKALLAMVGRGSS